MSPNPTEFILKTEVSNQDRSWMISPQVLAPAEQVLHYEIATEKTGRSGRSQTHQSGQVRAIPNRAITLATVNIGLAPEDICIVTIQVFVGTELVAEKQIKLPR